MGEHVMEENIKKIICNILDRNIVIDNREDIRAYGMDSLLKVQLVIKIEEEFNIEFVDEDLDQRNFASVDEICRLNCNPRFHTRYLG